MRRPHREASVAYTTPAGLRASDLRHPGRVCDLGLEPDPAALPHACRSATDQFDTRRIERFDDLGQRIDVAADVAFVTLHALDGRQRNASSFGQCALVDIQKASGGTQLTGSNQGNPLSEAEFRIKYHK